MFLTVAVFEATYWYVRQDDFLKRTDFDSLENFTIAETIEPYGSLNTNKTPLAPEL